MRNDTAEAKPGPTIPTEDTRCLSQVEVSTPVPSAVPAGSLHLLCSQVIKCLSRSDRFRTVSSSRFSPGREELPNLLGSRRPSKMRAEEPPADATRRQHAPLPPNASHHTTGHILSLFAQIPPLVQSTGSNVIPTTTGAVLIATEDGITIVFGLGKRR